MTKKNADALPDEVDLEGPDNDGWYHTKVHDWIALNPDINHSAFRLYVVMRSLCIEKRAPVRRLKIEEIRRLVPGVNGKECSRTAIEDAIQRLKRNGLLDALDDPKSGGAVRWRVNDLPASPEQFEGWRNTFDKLDAIRAEEGEKPEVNQGVPGKPGRSGRGTRKTGQGTRKTGQGTRKTGQGTRKTGAHTPADQAERDHQEVFQDPSQEALEPTPLALDEGSAEQPSNHAQGGEGEPSKSKDDQAAEFFDSVPVSSAAWKSVRPHMLPPLYAAFWAALDEGHKPGFLRTWLSEDLPTQIQSLVGLWLRRMENLPDPATLNDTTKPAATGKPQAGQDYPEEPCGKCDGRPGESWDKRVIFEGSKPKPCPECHPYGRTNAPALRAVS